MRLVLCITAGTGSAGEPHSLVWTGVTAVGSGGRSSSERERKGHPDVAGGGRRPSCLGAARTRRERDFGAHNDRSLLKVILALKWDRCGSESGFNHTVPVIKANKGLPF